MLGRGGADFPGRVGIHFILVSEGILDGVPINRPFVSRSPRAPSGAATPPLVAATEEPSDDPALPDFDVGPGVPAGTSAPMDVVGVDEAHPAPLALEPIHPIREL